jgi:hypothetical protein
MTVTRLREEMPAAEFLSWSVYYQKKAQAEQVQTAMARARRR